MSQGKGAAGNHSNGGINGSASSGGLSYRDAGVDIASKSRAFELMKGSVRSTFGPAVVSDFGTFGPMFALSKAGAFSDPVLVASADGVGTKLKIAQLLDKHDTIGIDIVNHCIDDILTTGAAPLFFLDYFASGKLEPETVAEVVSGIARACRESGLALLGGETAEMPDFYAPGEYDLAGFIVGVVERERAIDGKKVKEGDIALGLTSSGLHTNGYSLVRKLFGMAGDFDRAAALRKLETHFDDFGRTLGEELLEPHRSYLNTLRPVLDRVHGLAHITGGGLIDNVPRTLPEGLAVRFDPMSWERPAIFDMIQALGKVDNFEMFHAFNLGIGMVVLIDGGDLSAVQSAIPDARVIGEVVARKDGPAVVIG